MAGGIVGINVGANKDAPDRIADYVQLIERFAAVASYVTVNISSPNTPGLRNLQQAAVLDDLLARVVDARERVAPTCRADAGAAQDRAGSFARRARRCRRHRPFAPGRRHDRRQHHAVAAGGPARDRESAKKPADCQAGRCFRSATRMLAETYVRVEGVFPLIGAGGIDSGANARSAKIRAGASLIQLYSGLVFRGLGLLDEIKAALIAALERDRLDSLVELVGADAAAVTAEPWPG